MSASNQVHPVPDQNITPESDDDDDDDDDDNTVPDMQGMQEYDQCGNIQFKQMTTLPPPPPPEAPSEASAPHMQYADSSVLSQEEAKEAVLEMVAQHCCYGKGCARDQEITQTIPTTCLHYILKSFTESRRTCYDSVPYPGGYVDGPENGHPPGPWDIPCAPSQLFLEEEQQLEVPHTSVVKTCPRCHGSRTICCGRCSGRGHNRCGSCGGRGHRHRNGETVTCSSCGGGGRRRCRRCGGDGRVTCPKCSGHGSVRCFVKLMVNFETHEDDHIIEKTDMPDELVRDTEGFQVFGQTLPLVWPISSYPVQEINDNSSKLVQHHRVAFPNSRILQQSQELRAVPVTEVHFKWKDTSDRYWVYGKERSVYFPTYPQTCCWGCNIL